VSHTDTVARTVLHGCVVDAVAAANVPLTVRSHAALEGTFTVIVDSSGRDVVLLDAVPPHEPAFDDYARDRARTVAARLAVPLFAVTNFRRLVVYDTDNVTARLSDERQTVRWYRAADVTSLDDMRAAASSIRVTDAVRRMLLELFSTRFIPTTATSAEEFLAERTIDVLDDIVSCTDGSPHQRDAALRLGTSVVAYALLQMRRDDELDRLTVPYGMKSARLLLDVVGAYLREAHTQGFTMFPRRVDDLNVLDTRQNVFRGALFDLVQLLQRFDVGRLDDTALHQCVDRILQWSAGTRKRPAPTLDAIDLGLRAAALSNRTLTSSQRTTVLELGDSAGMVSVRQFLQQGTEHTKAWVYAPTVDDERNVLLRASGRVDVTSDVRILRRQDDASERWNLVTATITDVRERHRLRLLLQRLPMDDDGTVLLYVPMSVLHDERWTSVRLALCERFDIDWVIVSEARPLSEPDAGLCCIVAHVRRGDDHRPLARFVCVRTPLEEFFAPSSTPRELDGKRVAAIDAFVRYLDAGSLDRLNEEVLVRRVEQRRLRLLADGQLGAWEDLVVPPDILTSILTKMLPQCTPLSTYGHVASGLRTGANDVLLADAAEIAAEDLELRTWQRTRDDGSMVDNVILTSADNVVSVLGMPMSDERLLLVHESRSDLEGTNILTRIQRAEREGVHTRQSVRGRDPWYDVGDVQAPHLILPKKQDGRWLVCSNATSAFISDAFIGVHLHDPSLADALAAWMSSTPGLFLAVLSRRAQHVQDMTVRDLEDVPVPGEDVVQKIDLQRFRDVLKRPMSALTDELGATSGDDVSITNVKRDRRRYDAYLLQQLFAFTPEEERWMYRFVLAWQRDPANLRHLTNAVVHIIERDHKLRPLRQWYGPALHQLPDEHRRIILMPEGIRRAEAVQTMFSWQVVCSRGSRQDDVIDCSSQEEARIIAALAGLGKIHVEIPTDPVIIAGLLPRLESYAAALDDALQSALAVVPGHLHQLVDVMVRSAFTAD